MLAKKEKGETDAAVTAFLKKYKLDLIEIPEEFQDLEVEEDFKPKTRRASNRKIRPRSMRKDLTGFDAWRCFDRQLIQIDGSDQGVAKLHIPPALLVRAFGSPDESNIGFAGTG